MTTLNDGGASGSGWRRGVGPTNSTIPGKLRRSGGAASFAVALAVLAIFTGPSASAGPGNPNPPPPDPPSDSDVIRPLGVITPTASNWQPKFPFPYDQTRNQVTDADITSMREMCQWYNADYPTLRDQIDRLQFNRIGPDGKDYDYGRGDIQQQVDIVTGNIAQAVDFLTPRAQALTQAQNPFGDNYFPIYKGEAFYKLWEQLFNVNNGILAHQPDWFTGPSVQKAKRWGSDIHRSHVCD
jgi:hypothetical protein